MNTMTPHDTEIARMQTAADWVVRLIDAPADDAAVAEWLQWCEGDPENLCAFERAQKTWQLAGLGESVKQRQAANRWRVAGWAAAACLVLAGTAAVWMTSTRTIEAGAQSYATPIGGMGSSVLSDGSTVDLGAHSRITTNYSSRLRGVTVEAGEAYFTVAKDPQRPFVVTAGGLSVTAIGTQFNVRRRDDRVVVAVSEGKVRLTHDSPQPGDEMPLGAGQRAVYLPASKKISLATIAPEDTASWRVGVLKYVHEPLSAVTADLNRYSTRPIRFSDPTLAALPFTGTVFSANVIDALRALEDVFPVTVVELDDRIELQRRP